MSAPSSKSCPPYMKRSHAQRDCVKGIVAIDNRAQSQKRARYPGERSSRTPRTGSGLSRSFSAQDLYSIALSLKLFEARSMNR